MTIEFPQFELRDIYIYLAVCEHRNMTAAAKQLGLTQSAVSQHINAMEESFGVCLLNRDVRPLTLTPAGKVLACHGKTIKEEVEKTTRVVRSNSQGKIPKINIGLPMSVADLCLPTLIPELSKYVDQISVRSNMTQSLSQALANRELDIIVSHKQIFNTHEYEKHRLISEPFIGIYPENFKSPYGEVDLTSLALSLPFVSLANSTYLHNYINEYFLKSGIDIRNTLEIGGLNGFISMVDNHLGWTVATPLLLSMAHKQGNSQRCKLLCLPKPGLCHSLHVIARRNEMGDLPKKITCILRKFFKNTFLPDMKQLVPNLAEEIKVYGNDDDIKATLGS